MKKLDTSSRCLTWCMALLLSAAAAGCGGGGGGRDPILGTGGATAALPPSGAIVAPPGSIIPGAVCTAAAGAAIPTVTASDPISGNQFATTGTSGVAGGGKSVTATFSLAMNATTINAATFAIAPTGGTALMPASVSYNATSKVATLTTSSALLANTSYTAIIQGAVASAAGTAIGCNYAWSFKTAAVAATGPAPIYLGAASTFGAFGGNATVTNDGLNTVVNGDLGVNAASSKITGFRDSGANIYTVTPTNNGLVTGLIYTLTAPPASVAGAMVTQARIDATAAFNAISPAILPGGIDMSNLAQCASCGGAGGGADELAGRILPPGVYKSTTGTYDIGGPARTVGNLTLDAKGDANAVWIFQTAAGTGTLNVGLTGPATPAVPIKVLLVNGALAKNVFWYVPAGAIIGTGATMTGTMLSDAAITMSTTGGGPPPSAVTTTLDGRAIALTAGVTMTNTVINVPAP